MTSKSVLGTGLCLLVAHLVRDEPAHPRNVATDLCREFIVGDELVTVTPETLRRDVQAAVAMGLIRQVGTEAAPRLITTPAAHALTDELEEAFDALTLAGVGDDEDEDGGDAPVGNTPPEEVEDDDDEPANDTDDSDEDDSDEDDEPESLPPLRIAPRPAPRPEPKGEPARERPAAVAAPLVAPAAAAVVVPVVGAAGLLAMPAHDLAALAQDLGDFARLRSHLEARLGGAGQPAARVEPKAPAAQRSKPAKPAKSKPGATNAGRARDASGRLIKGALKPGSLADQIIKLLGTKGPMKSPEIATSLGGITIGSTLSRLVRDGRIRKTGDRGSLLIELVA